MKKQTSMPGSLSAEDAKMRITSWRTCLPNELSNLFYYTAEGEVHRYNNYFYLEQTAINSILVMDVLQIQSMRIYMGCSKPENEQQDKFAPVLSIVDLDKKETYFPLNYQQAPTKTSAVRSPKKINARITPGIVDLFQVNWAELNEIELADAFSGITPSKLQAPNAMSQLQTRRVQFYDFPQTDVRQMFSILINVPAANRYLRLLLGAGLTVRITHPFNFRPIIAIPTGSSQHQAASKSDDDSDETHFERSQPCPPYCPNGESGKLSH